jgi:hypothetical protein
MLDMGVMPHAAWAQGILENPQPDSYQSGISVVSGWKCTAGTVTVQFDKGPLYTAAYGTIREDTQGVCGDQNNGFGLLWNWNRLGDGQHTVRVFDNGVQFGQATFTVTTLGAEFLRGVTGSAFVLQFPNPTLRRYSYGKKVSRILSLLVRYRTRRFQTFTVIIGRRLPRRIAAVRTHS